MARRGTEIVIFEGTEKQIALDHSELCGLIPAAAGTAEKRNALFEKYRLRHGSPDIKTNRIKRIIYGPDHPKALSEIEREIVCDLIESECATLILPEWQIACKKARNSPVSEPASPVPPASWENLLDDHRAWLGDLFLLAPQEALQSVAGPYFIVRRITRPAPGYVVSFMTIDAGSNPRSREPARFRTLSPQRPMAEYPEVNGLFYKAGDYYYALGKVRGEAPFRASILRTRPQEPEGGERQRPPPDLYGLRLGMGQYGAWPQAYRIWCVRLGTPPSGKGWPSFVNVYRDADAGFGKAIAPYVIEFDEMVRWLGDKRSLQIGDDDEVPPS